MLAIFNPLFVFLAIFGVGAISFLLLKNSRWWNKTAPKIYEEPNFSEPETETVIRNIDKTKSALDDRAKQRGKQAEELTAEKKQIETYLDSNKGDTKTEVEDNKSQ